MFLQKDSKRGTHSTPVVSLNKKPINLRQKAKNPNSPKMPSNKVIPAFRQNLSLWKFFFKNDVSTFGRNQRFCLARLKNTRVFHGTRLHGLHALQILRQLRCGRLDKLKTKPQHPTAVLHRCKHPRHKAGPFFWVRSGRMTSLNLTLELLFFVPQRVVWMIRCHQAGKRDHETTWHAVFFSFIYNYPVIWKILRLFSSPMSREIDHPNRCKSLAPTISRPSGKAGTKLLAQ